MKISEILGKEKYDDLVNVLENASSGATSSGNIGTVVGGLGAGFDPSKDHGVYSKKKNKKLPIIKR